MADCATSLARTLCHEGAYSNIAGDRGGETYKGIARNFHPTWPGWQIIDKAKRLPEFPKSLEHDKCLQSLVAEFYKAEFWDKISGDKFPNQAIANQLFDCAVNMGVSTAVIILQESLNFLTPTQSQALAEDSVIGPMTFHVLDSWLIQSNLTPAVAANALLSVMLVLRGERYLNIIERNSSQKQFAYGWFRRVLANPELDNF